MKTIHQIDDHDVKPIIKFQQPFTCLMAGSSGSGKTTFVKRFLKHASSLCTPFNKIIWCFSGNGRPNDIQEGIQYMNGLPQDFECLFKDDDDDDEVNSPKLIILDDLMTDACSSSEILDIFTKHSHHYNISVFLLVQNIFHKGHFSRDISLNSKYIVLFKNPRDRSQIYHLARQICPTCPKEVVDIYNEATVKPFSYLLFDNCQTTNDQIRLRTCIFPDEMTIVYVPISTTTTTNTDHETIEIQCS